MLLNAYYLPTLGLRLTINHIELLTIIFNQSLNYFPEILYLTDLKCRIQNPPAGFDIIQTYKLPQWVIINPKTKTWIPSLINIYHTINIVTQSNEMLTR